MFHLSLVCLCFSYVHIGSPKLLSIFIWFQDLQILLAFILIIVLNGQSAE